MNWSRAVRALALALTGCQSSSSGPFEAAAPSANADPRVREIVQGNTAFAADLYARLRGEPGNLFFSPWSISTALAMTYAGARGETATEMQRTLHFPPDAARLHEGFALLLAPWRAPGPTAPEPTAAPPRPPAPAPELFTANRLWCQAGFTLRPAFAQITREQYGAPAEELDFARHPEPSREAINDWVAAQTRDKIKDLLAPGILGAATRLVLTNAIYFKGAWEQPFPESRTKSEPFFVEPARSHPVPMMHVETKAGYAEVDDAKVLELPYRSSDPRKELSLVLVLPDDKDGLPRLEASLDARALSSWMGHAKRRSVLVALPRFKLTSAFELSATLSALGMKRAFGGSADFSGIAEEQPLAISAVLHKAFVDVDEKGTEAAAATAVMITVSALVPVEKPAEFRADHPFLMILCDRATGSILFMGRVVDPLA